MVLIWVKRINFFAQEKKNDWKNLLDSEIGNKINLQFKSEMNELGYI